MNSSLLPHLSVTILIPLIGALFIMLFARSKSPERSAANAKNTALWTSIFTFLWSLNLLYFFDYDNADFQFEEKITWLQGYNINYHLGVDGLAISMIVLTTFLLPICILASWKSIQHRIKEFMVAFLMLESFVIGVFCAMDMLLFYIFFEAVLIPMYFVIGIWGGKNRIYAAFKFFLYTLLGSVLLLVAILYLYNQFGTMEIPTLAQKAANIDLGIAKWLWLAMFASFAVKVPMWPFHTWLPDAHVQAPTAGSVILAGVLLKMGAYGFLRFSLPFFPEASQYYQAFVYTLSVIAIIYASLVAFRQTDMKKLIAYSSVAHMGFVTLGIFSFNEEGLSGAVFQMVSHGIVSGALFLCVGVIYDRMHTREIKFYGGLVDRMPKYALVMMIFTMASVGLPGTSGFVGEFLTLLGAYKESQIAAILAGTGLVFGALYMLWLYRQVIFSKMENKKLKEITDIETREIIYFVPLIILVILLGVYPSVLTDMLRTSIANITNIYK